MAISCHFGHGGTMTGMLTAQRSGGVTDAGVAKQRQGIAGSAVRCVHQYHGKHRTPGANEGRDNNGKANKAQMGRSA